MHSLQFKVPPEQQWLNISSLKGLTHQCLFFGTNWHRRSRFGHHDVIYLLCMQYGWGLLKNASILLLVSVHICFMHAIVFTRAYLFIWSSVLFGYCRTESWSNWADTRLWLILLMSDASRGEDTERKNCQTNIQVTSFIPPTSSSPLCLSILRKGFSAPLVHRWLHHCLLRLLSLLQVCRIYLEEIWEKAVRLNYKRVARNIHAPYTHFGDSEFENVTCLFYQK